MSVAFTVLDLAKAAPEIFLAVAGMALLLLGAFSGEKSARPVTYATILAFVIAILLLLQQPTERPDYAFGALMRIDAFGTLMKILVLIGASLALILSVDSFERDKIGRFEYPVLVLFATVGMMLMISANDLMSLYMGLELQSLALYVIAAFHRDNVRSTEAGLKYFVLGALSSGLLLYGASLVYGFAGSTNFANIAAQLNGATPALGVIIGLVFVIAALAFKVSAVPFHMWTPDVYEGAPTPVTALFAAAPKIAAMALFIRVLVGPFGDMVAQWQQVVVFVSIASMAFGAIAALVQTNIKRLMAYSSIGHMGFALMGLAANSDKGVSGIIVYLALYMVMSAGTFALIIAMRRDGQSVEKIDDLAGLGKTRPAMALGLMLFMFSMAGIPPLAGFFGKLYVFQAAIDAGLVTLAVIGVLSSAVGAYYYLRVIKVMYFDQPQGALDPMAGSVTAVAVVTALANGLFFLWPASIIDRALGAAAAIIGG